MTNELWWAVARSGGMVAWGLLALSVLWGLALSTKVLGKRPRPNWLLDVHRFLGGLAVAFVAVHVIGLMFDKSVSFGLTQVLVPFTSGWRAGPVTAGVVGLYLLLAIEITSLLRKRLPKRIWHGVHLLSYLLYATSTLHALTAGTDAAGRPFLITMTVTSVAIVSLTIARLDQAMRKRVELDRSDTGRSSRATIPARSSTPVPSRRIAGGGVARGASEPRPTSPPVSRATGYAHAPTPAAPSRRRLGSPAPERTVPLQHNPAHRRDGTSGVRRRSASGEPVRGRR